MFLELLLFLFLGLATGVAAGLIPGLHPNTLFIIILSLSQLLASFPIPCFFAFIISAALCNTFVNFIPSILFGAPEPDSCLSVLPGHRFLMQGKGYEALFLTVAGGVGVTILTLLTIPLLLYLIPTAYSFLHPYIHVILIFIVAWMCLSERNRSMAFFVFMLAGIFGFISLNSIPSEVVLFPALTGLFGISTLIVSTMNRTTIPPQEEPGEVSGSHIKGSVAGWLAGMLVGLLPGIGAAQAGVIVAQAFRAKIRDFLTALGGINTANIFFTFIVFYTLGKTRSGAAWAISQIIESVTVYDILLLMCIGAIACFISAFITLRIGRFVINRITHLDYNKINITIISLLIILILVFSGLLGLLIAFVGTCIGLFAILTGTRRTQLMGFLILPTILYFSGLSALLLVLTGL